MMMNDEAIVAAYVDPTNPTSFGNPTEFRNYLKSRNAEVPSLARVTSILRTGVPSFTLFRTTKEKFPRRVLKSAGLDSSWSAGKTMISGYRCNS